MSFITPSDFGVDAPYYSSATQYQLGCNKNAYVHVTKTVKTLHGVYHKGVTHLGYSKQIWWTDSHNLYRAMADRRGQTDQIKTRE